MNNDNLDTINDARKCIDLIKKLEEQKRNPDRNGMIAALRDSLMAAPLAFMLFGFVTKHDIFAPLEDSSNNDLYRKLDQYKEVLNSYCISKMIERIFVEMRKEYRA